MVIGEYIHVSCLVLKYITQIACLHFAHRELEIFWGVSGFSHKMTKVSQFASVNSKLQKLRHSSKCCVRYYDVEYEHLI
jgi:hypothetical protein